MKETQLSYSDYLGISTYLMKHRAFNLYFGKSIASDARGPGSNPVIDNYLALTFEKSNISKKILGLAHFKQQKRSPRHSNNLLHHLFFQSIFNLLVWSHFSFALYSYNDTDNIPWKHSTHSWLKTHTHTIDCLWSPSLDSQHHPAIYWEHSSLQDICDFHHCQPFWLWTQMSRREECSYSVDFAQ